MAAYNRVLVTGSVGFIGSYLVDELLKRYLDVPIIDVFSSGRLESLSTALSNRRCKSLVGLKFAVQLFTQRRSKTSCGLSH